jgi:DNA polymerase III subunit gamma/tau
MTFDEVIGQDIIVSILKSIVSQKKYGLSYLFSGPSGTGKTTCGRIFAKAVLCESTVSGNPCCSCRSCKLFQEDKHFGFRELDSASFGGKEDMIKLRDDASFLSVENKKILLLDECHDISKQGQDALLKQVEQCPPHLMYIFCTTEPEKMKGTLRKRCIHFQFSKVDSKLIVDRLKKVCASEGIQFEEEAISLIADRSKGHVRDSLKLLEESSYLGTVTVDSTQKISQDYSELVFTVLSNLGQNLSVAINACKKASVLLSNWDFYEQILSMTTDAVKMFYGYDDFIPQRKNLLIKLRDLHGSNLLEFLNYLVSRDKYVDQIGLYSDIILLHYKFCSGGFKPQTPVVVQNTAPEVVREEPGVIPEPQESPNLTYAELSKLSIPIRSKILRKQKMGPEELEKEEPQKVPVIWPLPKNKESQQGANSFDDGELTPLEFSKRLVGGRGGGI